MKIAICSLSQYTHVAEVVDAAEELNRAHEVCYFVGFRTKATLDLLSSRGIQYKVLLDPDLDIEREMASADGFRSAEKLFEFFFFKHAEMILPALIEALGDWRPDVILSGLRDYAGLICGEVLDIPVATFGVTSPVRERQSDPPLFSGVSRDCPARMRKLMWSLYDNFHKKMDALYNQRLRRPYSLPDVRDVSTLHSRKLVFLWSIPSLANKYSPDPDYVNYVGPLATKKAAPISPQEQRLIERLELSPRPRVLITLGTFHSEDLLLPVMRALQDYTGTIVVCTGRAPDNELAELLIPENILWKPFFFCMNEILERCDAVVNVSSGKSTLDALSFGKPLVCLPRQGEQFEIAYRLQELGAAIAPCLRKWNWQRFLSAVENITANPGFAISAENLKQEIQSQGGPREVVRLIESLFGTEYEIGQ